MAMKHVYLVALIFWMSALDTCRPIMVTFGVSKGPIIPQEIKPVKLQPKNIQSRSPAPVKEDLEDIPNPRSYQPLVPHQYRTKLYSFKPDKNLLLGTALDQKYTPQEENRHQPWSKWSGLDYTGPHTFLPSYFLPKKTTLLPSIKYNKDDLFQKSKSNFENTHVPQIGIVYSSGVRYYIPQFVYYNPGDSISGTDENSVYDKNDAKFYHHDSQ